MVLPYGMLAMKLATSLGVLINILPAGQFFPLASNSSIIWKFAGLFILSAHEVRDFKFAIAFISDVSRSHL
jgi:hypothetical protein